MSSTSITFLISAADLATSQVLYVKVTNPVPGGGSSGLGSVTVLQQTPSPVLSQVTPTQIVMGSTDALIVVTGTNLAQQVSSGSWASTSQIQWNGTPLTTLWYSFYGNSQSITATVPANLLTALGTANVTAVSSTSTPATSNALTISIIPPPPPTVSSSAPTLAPSILRPR